MIYYDDITAMHGNEAAAVDVIIGGSPCQDLSVAGQRAGLDGERSSLFLDQIRVIKEAHSKYGRNKPRYMVWENVPGALSSANGEDFRRVLEETAKVADETAVIPRPEKGKWTTAGCIMGDGYSIAWRILDAQFWGVPQRRRRIALVADFGGQSAPEILFKSESVSGDSAESGEARQGTAGSAESGIGITNRGVFTGTVSETLRAESHSALPTVCVDEPIGFIYRQGSKAGRVGDAYGLSPTLRAEMLPAICIQGNVVDRDANCNGRGWSDNDVSYTLNTIDRPAVYDARENGNGDTAPTITGDHQNRVTDYTAICCDVGLFNTVEEGSPPLLSRSYKDPYAVCIPINTMVATRGEKLGRGTGFGVGDDGDSQFTISAAHSHAVFLEGSFGDFVEDGFGTVKASGGCLGGGSETFVASHSTVRRLTPLECERLQGYPDGWTDIGEWADSKGKKHQTTDSARYKALGNSIALPPWRFVCRRICEQYDTPATMGSLFDGIGGFPLIWREINGADSVPWSCEIDEYCKAVTRRNLP